MSHQLREVKRPDQGIELTPKEFASGLSPLWNTSVRLPRHPAVAYLVLVRLYFIDAPPLANRK